MRSTDKGAFHFSVVENESSRVTGGAQTLGVKSTADVGVQASELHLVFVQAGELFEDRFERFAGAAATAVEDQDNDAWCFFDFLDKVDVRDILEKR